MKRSAVGALALVLVAAVDWDRGASAAAPQAGGTLVIGIGAVHTESMLVTPSVVQRNTSLRLTSV